MIPSKRFMELYDIELFALLQETKDIIREEDYLFDMNYWNAPYTGTCGSVRCIGGTIEFLANGREIEDFYKNNHESYQIMTNLTYPKDYNEGWSQHGFEDPWKITAEQACVVIDSFIKNPDMFK